jgi:hypothetical protein
VDVLVPSPGALPVVSGVPPLSDTVEADRTPAKADTLEGGAKFTVVVTFDSTTGAPGSGEEPPTVWVMIVVLGLVATTVVVPPTTPAGGSSAEVPEKLAPDASFELEVATSTT